MSSPEFQGTRRFKLLRLLGEGGTGVVYEALDRDENARVALKVLHAMDADGILRFKNEFRVMQGLAHPNLVSLGELIEEEGRWFFTMEFVEGTDLLRWIGRGRTSATSATATTASLRIVPPSLDEGRLRAAFLSMARGLSTLHAAGKVHRDVKPSNILVTPAGRVVILDFGLVLDVKRPAHVTRTGHVVGTADYMAPEQAAGLAIGPPADWYAVGVMLYQALAGRLPWSGPDAEVLAEKQQRDPRPPSEVTSFVPSDLDALCMALLSRDPSQRPTGADLLRELRGETVSAPLPVALHEGAPFIGRRSELLALCAAFDDSRRGKAVTLFIVGESGVGKSALATRFAESAQADHGAVCLQSRCYDRESVPYKAFDGIVDSLARYMAELPPAEAAALLPLHAALLPRIFPVLRRVEAIAHAPPHPRPMVDPKELRTQVFAAMRELLIRLTMRGPVVLVIDDLQWTDADSLTLLQSILSPPDPPGLLLVATLRTMANVDAALPGEIRRVALERLPPEDARALTEVLLGDNASTTAADAIAREADGHPLFIDELVRNAAVGQAKSAQPRLEEVLHARIERLEEKQRDIVELVAVAGGPIAQETVAQAGRIDFAEFSRYVSALRSANLVRASGIRRGDSIEPYHDRVRAATLLEMTDDCRRKWHERLALALEVTGDAEARAAHWRAAGRPDWAARHALEAAAGAERALAFDRAAQLYRLVLELGPPEGEDAHTLQVRRADALANAGLSREAGQVYLKEADHAPHDQALVLRRKAGDQFMIGGYVDEAIAVYKHVLSAFGMRLAPQGRRAIPAVLWRRLQLFLRGLRFKERAATQISPTELQRIDLAYVITAGFNADPLRLAHSHTVHLLLALRAGEPARVSAALCGEAIYQASIGRPKRAERLLDRARELAERVGDARALAFSLGASGLIAFMQGRWKSGCEAGERCLKLFRERCTGVAWEVMQAVIFLMRALYYLGELKEIQRRLPLALSEARVLGNLYGVTHLLAGSSMYNLAHDDIEGSRAAAVEAVAGWSHRGVDITHLVALMGEVHTDLYAGAGRQAYERVRARWRQFRWAMFMQLQFLRVTMNDLRHRTALTAAAEHGADRKALLADAERCARRLSRAGAPWASALGHLAHAGVASARGHRDAALARLDAAILGFEGTDMALHAAVARLRKGELLGADGQSLIDQAHAWMLEQGIRKPDRIAAVLAPQSPER